MKKFCCKTRSMRPGFTLLEVLFTVLIVAILAAVAIPLYNNTRKDSEKKTCSNNQQAIANAESKYYFDKGAYVNDKSATVPSTALLSYGLAKWPTCPNGTDTYTVTLNADNTLTIACTDTTDSHGSITMAAPGTP